MELGVDNQGFYSYDDHGGFVYEGINSSFEGMVNWRYWDDEWVLIAGGLESLECDTYGCSMSVNYTISDWPIISLTNRVVMDIGFWVSGNSIQSGHCILDIDSGGWWE